jgi:hypothetical protein
LDLIVAAKKLIISNSIAAESAFEAELPFF